MVAADAAIDGTKLNIRSVAKELTDDGSLSVDASHVVMDDTTLEANYKTISTKIDTTSKATETLQTELKEVQGSIESKVWKSDIKEATDSLGNSITELSDKYTSQQQTIDGITTEIGDVQTSLESKADGSTVQALTGRVNKVEETATGFSRTISEIKTEVQGSVTDVAVYYALNNSETVPPADDDPGWSLEAPEWTEGMFMWQKTVTTYASGNVKTSSPTCLSGAVGADGEDAVLLRIDSSRGTVFKNNAVTTVLTVIIYKGSQRITTAEQMKAVFGSKARIEWEWQRVDEDRYGVISACPMAALFLPWDRMMWMSRSPSDATSLLIKGANEYGYQKFRPDQHCRPDRRLFGHTDKRFFYLPRQYKCGESGKYDHDHHCDVRCEPDPGNGG